jgi:excinuclease ABC subunit C
MAGILPAGRPEASGSPSGPGAILSGVSRKPPDLSAKLADLPDEPGVYRFLDGRGRVIYVGKAKSLRKRVSSYFQAKSGLHERTRALVAEIRDVDWLLTATEVEALVLENSLIKKSRPRFNVNLRDDKNFPHLRLTTSEAWPRVDVVRRPRRDEDLYFGPYVPASRARKTMRLLAQHFGIRSCKGDIEQKDHRACLYWHVDQCLAPCAGLCTKEEYDAAVRDATLFLRGHVKPLRERLVERMRAAADRRAFERAAHYRDLVRMLDDSRQPQRMASTGLEQQDAWGMHRSADRAFLVVGFVREGQLRGRREFSLRGVGAVPDDELLGNALRQYYHDAGLLPDEVLLPGPVDEPELMQEWLRAQAGRAVRLHVPRRGPKAERVRWASENARGAHELKLSRGEAAREGLDELAETLDLPAPPERIECFDVSNIQGADVVASLVVFVDGEPARREYRTYGVRTVEGAPDDFASMEEVVSRRYRRLVAEGRDLPDLVVVDGGVGQLGSAARALDALELSDLPLASIAKREELIHLRGRDRPVRLSRRSPALQLVQRLRDEAHRTAVGFHRRRRSARTLTSELDAVPGIGPARRRRLLRTFGSVEGVRTAGRQALEEVVGPKVARQLVVWLGGEQGSGER